jgi:transposase
LVLISQILAHIEFLEQAIAQVQVEIERCLPSFEEALELLQTIPGIRAVAAAAILAEIGADMARFPSAGHLVSWAGLCPSNKESAGKRMKGPVNRGNVWLRGIMGAFDQLRCEKQLEIVPGATHLFEEPGTLEEVARLARDWFVRHLVPGMASRDNAAR